ARTVAAFLLHGAFPAQHAPLFRPVGRMVDAESHDFIALFQPAAPVEAPVHHRAPVHELGPGVDERAPHVVRILDARLELELFANRRHANSARITAAVSPRLSKACVAPASRSWAAV